MLCHIVIQCEQAGHICEYCVFIFYFFVSIVWSFCMQDISSCLVAMSMLQKLPVTSHILAKNADILVTIKKVSVCSVCFQLSSFWV